jgi:hypothetical protein
LTGSSALMMKNWLIALFLRSILSNVEFCWLLLPPIAVSVALFLFLRFVMVFCHPWLIYWRKWDACAGVHVLLGIFRTVIINIWIATFYFLFSCGSSRSRHAVTPSRYQTLFQLQTGERSNHELLVRAVANLRRTFA